MPARNLLILILSAILSLLCYRTASRNHYGSLLASAIGEIKDTFVRPVDDRQLFEGAMDGMVRKLDPYSDYIGPDELTGFQEDLDQKFGGIGIVVEVDQKTGLLTVLSPLPDTPAFAAGMRAGDVILVIEGESTEGFQIGDAVKLMRGDPGTTLRITVRHAGETTPIDMELERAIIPIASVMGDVRNPDGTWQFTMEDHPNLAYVRVVSFGEKTAEELRETLVSLDSIEGLIVDLRGNGGGLLNAAIAVCDLFIDEGKIVSIRGRDKSGWRDYSASKAPTIRRNLPMVVLVDGYSASASEITAACLQDHQRAIIVGTRTWGKGTVQNVMPFEGGRSALKLTVATYWRPSEQNIHRHIDATEDDPWGVSPDEGCEVEVDVETLRKIFTLRRERDRVNIETGDLPEIESEMSDVVEQVEESTEQTEAPNSPSLPDIRGFEDPQLKRAIEAVQELIRDRTPALNAA